MEHGIEFPRFIGFEDFEPDVRAGDLREPFLQLFPLAPPLSRPPRQCNQNQQDSAKSPRYVEGRLLSKSSAKGPRFLNE